MSPSRTANEIVGTSHKPSPIGSKLSLRDVISILSIAVLYFFAAKFGLSLASVHTNVSPVWPPTGLAIAAILLLGYRAWPGILIGAFLANFLTPVPAATAVGIAIGNTLEAVSAGALLRSLGFRNSFDRARDVFNFVFAALLCTMVSATIGNLSLCLAHSAKWADFGSLWITWWLGDSVGALVVAPLLVTWATKPSKWLPANRQVEAVIIILLVALSSIATFAGSSPISVPRYPLARLTIPLFLWAAFRLGPRGVTLASIVLSVFAVWGTSNGLGPFISDTANDSLLLLQLFIGSNAATFLFLVSVVEERRISNLTLRENERRLAANLAIARILAESPALNIATPRILQTIGETLGWEVGDLWRLDDEGKVLRNVNVWRKSNSKANEFINISRNRTFEKGIGLPGRVWETLKPAWIPDVAKDNNFPRAPVAIAEHLHAGFAFPIVFNEKFLGLMEFFSHEIREPDEQLLIMFDSIGRQIGQFMQRKEVEDSLANNREALRLAHRIARGGTWQWDLLTNTVEWSDEYYELFGLKPGEVPASLDEWSRRLHPQDLPMVLSETDKTFTEKRDIDIEFRIKRADGQWRWFHRNGKVMYGQDGTPMSVVGITFDVTERRRAEEATRQLAAIVESTDDAVISKDLNGTITSWNPAAERLYGYAAHEVIGKPISILHPPERPDEEPAILAKLRRGERIDHYETIRIAKDGRRIHVSLTVSPIKDSSGRVIGASKITRDITEQKRAEEALRESRAQLENLILSAMDAVITIDEDQRIVIFNAAAEQMFGCAKSEAIGQPIDRFIPGAARLAHGERIALGALSGLRTSGEEFPIEASISQTEVNGKKLYTVILRDITGRKRAEAEREQLLASEQAARHQAEIASRAKDEFLAVLSHELRTPLTAMLGWLAILRDHRLDKQTTEHAIETIERNAKAQAQLIEDLVDISRIVGGKLNLEVRPIELTPVINAAIDVVRPAADAKNIRIKVTDDSTAGLVSADPARLQQVIWNLLSNSVKFTPKGGAINIELRRAGSSAEVVISDNGSGISEDFLPHVFERFRQAESAVIRSHRGMGLGLAIVRHLIELHGGTVSAHSDGENHGSRFTINLPLAAIADAADSASLAALAAEAYPPALNGVRILLVEDEPDARELIALMLRKSGAHVEAVDSAGDALQRLSLFTPHVLLSDIGLPLESGYDLIRKVRSLSSELNTVPAVALTAFATEGDRKRSISAGFQAHLAKPVAPTDLVETIKTVINGKS